MAKHELGKKHTCSACEAVFYDMRKPVPACPSCGTKTKASSGSPTPPPAPPEPTPKKSTEEANILEIESEDDRAMDNDAENEELIEQAEDDVGEEMKEAIETGGPGEASDQ